MESFVTASKNRCIRIAEPLVDGSAQRQASIPLFDTRTIPLPRPAHPGALQRAAVKDGLQGHRSSRRAASLRAARCNAKLRKGEDSSDCVYRRSMGRLGDTGVKRSGRATNPFSGRSTRDVTGYNSVRPYRRQNAAERPTKAVAAQCATKADPARQ